LKRQGRQQIAVAGDGADIDADVRTGDGKGRTADAVEGTGEGDIAGKGAVR
jgi:hypothetical protein